MVEPIPSNRRPRHRNADYRWTRAKVFAFLKALSLTGSVRHAASSVGMSRQSAYRLRARMGPDFAAVWDEGVLLARAAGCPGFARKATPRGAR